MNLMPLSRRDTFAFCGYASFCGSQEGTILCNACTAAGGKCVDENNKELPRGGGRGYCDCTDLTGSDRTNCEEGKKINRRPIIE
jgi:hypothetical protein